MISKKDFLSTWILLLSLCFLMSCSFSKDIQISRYAQKQQIHKIIDVLQPSIDAGEEVSAFDLYFLSASYISVRNYSKALATIDLMQKRIDAGDKSYVGSDLTVYPQILRGTVYLEQGEPQKAIHEGELAYKLLHEGGRDRAGFYTSQLIDIYNLLGVAYAVSGESAKGRNTARKLEGVSADAINGAAKYIALARIYMALKKYDLALEAIRNPAAKVSGFITAFFDQTFQEIPNLFVLTKSLYETGRIKEAREGYDQLLRHPQIAQIGGIYWIVLLDRSRIALSDGQRDIAEDLLKKAIDVIETSRSSITSEAGRIGFVGDKQTAYSDMTKLLLAAGRYAEAFSYVERSKARALVDLLASQKNIGSRGLKKERVETTLAELDKAERDLAVVAPIDDQGSQSKTRSIALALKKDLQEKAPELASLVSVTPPSTADIQGRLQNDETLLEYYCSGQDWYLFVVTPKVVTAQRIPAADLEGRIDMLRKHIAERNNAGFEEESRALYRQLFAPAMPSIKTTKVIVVPHGPLHYLPFAALSDGKGYLVDRFSIRMLPSASVLVFLKSPAKQGEQNALIFGNPNLNDERYDLKFAQDEALAIGRILPNSRVLLRGEASKANLLAWGERYSLVHLAVHGVFDQEKPLDSALLLAADGKGSGLLRVGDIYQLSLKADLVSLSACETALGKVATGDDVVGFTRGFLYAGARSLLSSLWQVDDKATHDLMVAFYSNLSKMDKDEALRQAQIKTKRQYAHPYYWAAFLITGSAR
ncbi:MAG TPA: CHAT domain-containing protein [Syntrophales bacterium]|nr:CHAT domain-containing protein [Syntrophobacterales bacterium]HRR39762.1 CHAT domain-containing protein [Syntrophales bacterium]